MKKNMGPRRGPSTKLSKNSIWARRGISTNLPKDKRWEKPWWVVYEESAIPRRKLYVEKIMNHRPESVLELGCAGGCNINFFPEDIMKNITGVDINEAAIKFAKDKNLGCEFLSGDITKKWDTFGIKDQKFDIVCSMGTLIHISPKNIDFVLKNMINSCSKGIILIEGSWPRDEGVDVHNPYETQVAGKPTPQYIYNIPEKINRLSQDEFTFSYIDLPDNMRNRDVRFGSLKIIEAIRK